MNNFEVKYGYLIKEENLVSLHEKIYPNTFVLEANDPFPGYYEYHQEISFDVRPHYIYYVTKKAYNQDKFTRATIAVLKKIKHNLSAALGNIELRHKLFPVIRIRRLKDYEMIAEIQKAYLEEDIEFAKNPYSSKINDFCMIHLKKFLIINRVEKEIYLDTHNENLCYFEIPKYIQWRDFVDLTKAVRYNVDVLHFDASKGSFIGGYEIADFVRIYGVNLDIPKIRQLRQKYLERI